MTIANVTFPIEELPAQIAETLEHMSTSEAFSALSNLEELLLEAPLHNTPSYVGHGVEVFGEKYDTYEFVITRRFAKDEQKYVGGANGEIVNVTELLSTLRQALNNTWKTT